MERLFSYGTLKYPAIQKKIIGRIEDGIPAILVGYKIVKIFSKDYNYRVIVKDKKGSVCGKLLYFTKKEIKLMDKYEGDNYKRDRVLINGKKAWVYKIGKLKKKIQKS